MKLLVVSDVESKFIWDHFDREYFRDVGLIISCGDLAANYLSFLVTMLPCPLLYVPGNHDKRYAVAPPLGCSDIDGKLIVWHGLRILGLGGCKTPRGLLYEYTDRQMWGKVRRLEPASFHEGFDAFRWLDETWQPTYHLYGHVHLSGSPVDRRAFIQYGPTTLVNATGYKLLDVPEPKTADRSILRRWR